jgi:YD repeat-containing protein
MTEVPAVELLSAQKTYPNGEETLYAYTPTGQVEVITDTRGTTHYTYDLRDRVIGVLYPTGAVISYTYDAAGNRTSVTSASGTIAYAMMVSNRLERRDRYVGPCDDYMSTMR